MRRSLQLIQTTVSPAQIARTVRALVENDARIATLYVSPKLTVRASRTLFSDWFSRKQLNINLTIGPPNYAARQFIKTALKAKEPFPVKKIQLTFPAKAKRKAAR
jgi:hypothetical protein